MSTLSQLAGISQVPIGGIIPVSGAVVTTGTPYLKADGSDVLATDYPKISGGLAPATSADMRGVFGTGLQISGIAFGNGIYIALPFVSWYSASRYNAYVLTSVDGITWVQRNTMQAPYVSGNNPMTISFCNGKFYLSSFSYSGYNYILSSVDGMSWTNLFSDSTKTYSNSGDPNYYTSYAWVQQITYVNGVYFAPVVTTTATNGALYGYYTSTNGTNWTVRNSPIGYSTAITYGAGLYVMVGGDGTTYSSTDYINWTVRTNTATGGGGWSCVCFGVGASVNGGNGAFVSVQGWVGVGTSIGYSTNGTSWTQYTVPSGRYYRVIYANGLFVAVGETTTGTGSKCVTSPDGITWTERTIPVGKWWDITYNAVGGFVAVQITGTAKNYCAVSTDGITWTAKPMNADTHFTDVCYGTGLGYMTTSFAGVISTSPDGNTWTQKTNSPNAYSIACNPSGSIYVSAVNTAGAIYSTPDAVTWTSRYGGMAGVSSISRVRWCNDKFIVMGQTTSVSQGGGRVAYSYDGITWTLADSSVLTADGYSGVISMQYLDVTYGNGMYVIVGSDSYNTSGYGVTGYDTDMSAWSIDGITWNMTQNMPTKSTWTGVAYGNGVFVAVSKRNRNTIGNGSIVLYNPTYGGYSGNMFNGETTGRLGRECAVSTNGIDWISSLLPFAAEWLSITFNGHLFIAVASYSKDYAVSKDGYNWTIRTGAVQGFWNNIASGPNNTSIVVGGTATVAALPNTSNGSVNVPSVALKITESATMVTLPYVKPQDGINYVVKVK